MFVVWLNYDPKKPSTTLASAHNWGGYPDDAGFNFGYSTVMYGPASKWGQYSEDTETFIHEWIHQLENYYDGVVGLPMPGPGDSSYLHAAGTHGYTRDDRAPLGELSFWRKWYKDIFQQQVRDPGGMSGFGDNMQKYGTISQHKVVPVVLNNADMEHPNSQWQCTTWRNNRSCMVSDPNFKVTGSWSCSLNNPTADDARTTQKVNVKRNTVYLFSGWVKTQNVKAGQTGAAFGANLCVMDLNLSSQSIWNTQDWTWVSLGFNSGNRTQVELACRLGQNGSVVTGKAWYDNMHLVEVK